MPHLGRDVKIFTAANALADARLNRLAHHLLIVVEASRIEVPVAGPDSRRNLLCVCDTTGAEAHYGHGHATVIQLNRSSNEVSARGRVFYHF